MAMIRTLLRRRLPQGITQRALRASGHPRRGRGGAHAVRMQLRRPVQHDQPKRSPARTCERSTQVLTVRVFHSGIGRSVGSNRSSESRRRLTHTVRRSHMQSGSSARLPRTNSGWRTSPGSIPSYASEDAPPRRERSICEYSERAYRPLLRTVTQSATQFGSCLAPRGHGQSERKRRTSRMLNCLGSSMFFGLSHIGRSVSSP